MARRRYDSQWKEVKDINGYAMLLVYTLSAIRGIGFLVVTWTTVVLLGGFVSMVDKKDFLGLTLVTLIQILWINVSFLERIRTAGDQFSSLYGVKSVLTLNWQLDDYPLLVQSVLLYLCFLFGLFLLTFGLLITSAFSIVGLMDQNYYGDKDESKINMDPADSVLYILCVAQGALFLYRSVLLLLRKRKVNQVSQAYGFEDGGHAVFGYLTEITGGYSKKISSAGERNLITYAIELMESKSSRSFLSGTLILDRLLTRKHSNKMKDPTFIRKEEEKQQQQEQRQLDLQENTGVPLVKNDKKKKREEAKEERNKKREEQKKKKMEERKKKRGNKKWANKEQVMKWQHRQQTEEDIIVQQRRVIKRLIGSASSTNILQKLLDTLDSKRSHDKKMREAAVRIVEHVADRIRLDQSPRGIQCISSLINSFEEYYRLQPHRSSSLSTNKTTKTSPTKNDHDQEQGSSSISSSDSESGFLESDSDSDVDQLSSKALHVYKDLVLTGLRILWSLAGSEDNCVIISNTKQLVSKILAHVSCDLLHRVGNSEWSTKVSKRSLGVILRLIVTAKGDTRADLLQQISNVDGAITTMESIVTCEICKGGKLQMKAMQILTQLWMDKTANRSNLTKMLASIFVNGENTDRSIRKTAGKTLVTLFLSTKSVSSLIPKEENDKFVGNLAKILLQVGDNDTCRRSAAEILEHLCIQYTENAQYLSTFENTMKNLMPKVLGEILSASTGEEGNHEYARSDTDVESQATTNNDKNNNNNRTSSSPGQNQRHKLYVALLSLYVTACDKLHLDLAAISPGDGGDQATYKGECVAFSLGIKMVRLNKNLITTYSLAAMKLTTRMVIKAMKKKLRDHDAILERADLESFMDSLSSVSATMLDLESCMVFATGATTLPATTNTLDSLVKEAVELHGKIKVQESGNSAS